MKKTIFWSIALAVCIFPAAAFGSSVPQVVVSIKPLHSLVAGVMQGVGQPQLLVKGGGSPHGYILRPSEAQALSRADMIVWVGEELESFMEKPLSTLGRNARQLKLAEQLHHLLLRRSESHNSAHHHHHDSLVDLHLWLDPQLAQHIVRLTGIALAELDPAHSAEYQANTAGMIVRLELLHQHLQQQLLPVKDVPFIVFHAAYRYFEVAYGLNSVGSISIDPDRQPGVKRIKAIRDKIKQLHARCVFSEPQFESHLVATVISGTTAGSGVLDPLGATIPAGTEAYFQLMTRLGDSLYDGLK
ncbi:MAG: zinc ABC transporter substrate-binding protein [Desulfuromonadales bacterium]|nr:zinc ABC transporter substrate-binding protein [Desulfuromonadales bacterium]